MLQSSLKSRDRDKAYKDFGVNRGQIFLVDAGHAVLSTLFSLGSGVCRENA
jgi:hypothetical protein